MYQKRPNPNGVGRKGAYKPDFQDQAYRLALLGLTDVQMAQFFGVSPGTIDYWKQHREDFREALKKGKLEADSKVAMALYQRAIGYTHKDTHITVIDKKVVVTEIEKHYPPDAWACLKWLSIRQREQWADISKIEHTVQGQMDITHIQEQLSDSDRFTEEELKLALKLGVARAMDNNAVSDN